MYPNTFYRVSVKALITDKKGQILVVKENQDTWDLPGGGLDHGEDAVDGIQRELKEELGIVDIGKTIPYCVKTLYLEHKQAWLMWVVYQVDLNSLDFKLGNGVTEASFIDPKVLESSNDVYEKMVYEVVLGIGKK